MKKLIITVFITSILFSSCKKEVRKEILEDIKISALERCASQVPPQATVSLESLNVRDVDTTSNVQATFYTMTVKITTNVKLYLPVSFHFLRGSIAEPSTQPSVDSSTFLYQYCIRKPKSIYATAQRDDVGGSIGNLFPGTYSASFTNLSGATRNNIDNVNIINPGTARIRFNFTITQYNPKAHVRRDDVIGFFRAQLLHMPAKLKLDDLSGKWLPLINGDYAEYITLYNEIEFTGS